MEGPNSLLLTPRLKAPQPPWILGGKETSQFSRIRFPDGDLLEPDQDTDLTFDFEQTLHIRLRVARLLYFMPIANCQ